LRFLQESADRENRRELKLYNQTEQEKGNERSNQRQSDIMLKEKVYKYLGGKKIATSRIVYRLFIYRQNIVKGNKGLLIL